jgi:hypothetical protein
MNVRFEGNNGHDADVTRCPLLTQSGHRPIRASHQPIGDASTACSGPKLQQAYRRSLIANKAAFGSFVWDRPTEIDFNVDNFAVSHGQNFSVTERSPLNCSSFVAYESTVSATD